MSISIFNDYQEMDFGGLNFLYIKRSLPLKSFEMYQFQYESNLEGNCSLYSNNRGKKAVVITESVPTFYSGDREWDSYRKLFLIPENGKVAGCKVYGGYKIAKIEYFSDIRWGNEKTKKAMDKTGLFSNK